MCCGWSLRVRLRFPPEGSLSGITRGDRHKPGTSRLYGSGILDVDIARLALESRGGKKNVKETMRYQVILNKADTTRRRQFAQEICRELEKRGFADVTVTAEGRQEEE